MGCIEAVTHLELRPVGLEQPVEVDRGPALLERRRDGLVLAQAAVEPDRKAPRRVVVDRSAHTDHAVDMGEQRLGDRRGVARVEHDEPDRRSHSIQRLRERPRRHHLAATVRTVEHHAGRLAAGRRGGAGDIATLHQIRGRNWTRAVSAEVNNSGPQLAQLAQQVERLGRPPGHEVEPIPIASALQLDVDRARLLVERQAAGVARVGRQEQDHVLLRCPSLRWLHHGASSPARKATPRSELRHSPCAKNWVRRPNQTFTLQIDALRPSTHHTRATP
jgi:hypothetical protein